jgi:DNA-directed RNA polymerase subunit RPC12/RpoP
VTAKCTCNNCSGRVEFEAEAAGQAVACPHCGMETVLHVPAAPIARRGKARSRWVGRAVWGGAILVGAMLIAVATGYWVEPFLESRWFYMRGVLQVLLYAAVILVCALWAVLWILFPVFVYFQLKEMVRLLKGIEANGRAAVRERSEGEGARVD